MIKLIKENNQEDELLNDDNIKIKKKSLKTIIDNSKYENWYCELVKDQSIKIGNITLYRTRLKKECI